MKPCDKCPWTHGDPICEREEFKAAALAGKTFMCHATTGHPPCSGVKVWRKKQNEQSRQTTQGNAGI